MSANDLAKLSLEDTTAVTENGETTSISNAGEVTSINAVSETDMTELSLADDSHTNENHLETPFISNVEVVTSYNWLNTNNPDIKESPEIAVPGLPAKWLLRTDTPQLKPDTAARWVDQTNGQWPNSPFEPGIRAVLHQMPDYDFTGIHLITGRNLLSDLLELACGNESFLAFGAQVIGNTIVFFPTEPPRRTTSSRFGGFRQAFQDTYVQYGAGLEASSQHFCIIRCRIGGLEVMLRYSADAHLPDFAEATGAETAGSSTNTGNEAKSGDFTIKSLGTLMPHEGIVDLNTRKKHNESDDADRRIKQKLREAWLSQTHHFVIASYTYNRWVKDWRDYRGLFKPEDIVFKNKDQILEESGMGDENMIQAFDEKLKTLLKNIRSAADEGNGDSFVVKHQAGADGVTITPTEFGPRLCDELCDRLKRASR